MKNKIILLLFGMLLPAIFFGQTIEPDTTKTEKINVDYADLFEYTRGDTSIIQKLMGNVELTQDSIYMYCDTATIENNTYVVAKGNVIIQQGDSLSIFSDSLTYDGEVRIADLYGDVVLHSKEQQLFTTQLHYDANTKVATYQEGATLTNGETQLTSRKGYYYVDTAEVYFRDSVVVVDPEFTLRSDTLKYNTNTKITTFLGPTLIIKDSSRIYCEEGFYDTEANLSEFRKNAQFQRGEQKATADVIRYVGEVGEYILEGNAIFKEKERQATADVIRYIEAEDKTVLKGNAYYKDDKQEIRSDEIIYDAENEAYSTKGRSYVSDPPQLLEADQIDYSGDSGLGLAYGDVIWQDTSAELSIFCGFAAYDQQSNYLKASGGELGRPLLVTKMDGESLFLASDTLLSFQPDTSSTDSVRILLAYHDVRVFKDDLQAVCDSLAYNTTDSIFQFFQDPYIWSDTSQFSADTIHMKLSEGEIDRIFLYNNSFIVNSEDELYFNQIKGKNITAFFEEGELRNMDVQGNAESVYYALDDFKAYIGVNKTICSNMLLSFGDNQIESIRFFDQPQAKLTPMQQADHNELKLKGFYWRTKGRPKKMSDLFTPKSQFATFDDDSEKTEDGKDKGEEKPGKGGKKPTAKKPVKRQK
ncbi:MAG: hypothetical protein GY705_08105 [Bacteroidetes bacterium]|nr:hypothetical protein [Bacteroidota bacterium]